MAEVMGIEGQVAERSNFVARTYAWMAVALVISAASAFFTAGSKTLLGLIFGNPFGYMACVVIELALVVCLSAFIRKMSVALASLAFVAYAVVNGVTLSSIFWMYTNAAIARTFIVAALMFGGMAIFGAITKQRLDTAARYLIMALWGVVIASVVNIFLKSNGLDWMLSLITVVLFTGLTAYDAQKIQKAAVADDGSEVFKKASIVGALELYLDFINIFLSLLRLFGRRD